MAKILEMPKLAPTMEEGVLAIWHKKAGDAVQVDDLLAEVETDKATMEFRAFDKGTILKLLVEPGAKVLFGQPVAILGNPGEDTAGLEAKAGGGAGAPGPQAEADRTSAPPTPASPSRAATPVEQAPANAVARPTMAPAPAAGGTGPAVRSTGPAVRSTGRVSEGSLLDRTTRDAAPTSRESRATTGDDRVMASPYVRKAARERGIDLHGAVGSGPGGRIVAGDLDGIASTPANG